MKKQNLISGIVAATLGIGVVSASLALYIVQPTANKTFNIGGSVSTSGSFQLTKVYNQLEKLDAADNVNDTTYKGLTPTNKLHLRYKLGFDKSTNTEYKQDSIIGHLKFTLDGALAPYLTISDPYVNGYEFEAADDGNKYNAWGTWSNSNIKNSLGTSDSSKDYVMQSTDTSKSFEADVAFNCTATQYFDVVLKLTQGDNYSVDDFINNASEKALNYKIELTDDTTTTKLYLRGDMTGWQGQNEAYFLAPDISAAYKGADNNNDKKAERVYVCKGANITAEQKFKISDEKDTWTSFVYPQGDDINKTNGVAYTNFYFDIGNYKYWSA